MENNRNLILLFSVLLIGGFLRFYNLMWGGGYFWHPDERNMAVSVSRLALPKDIHQARDCFSEQFIRPFRNNAAPSAKPGCDFNPGFFAYGQFPLYMAFFLYVFAVSLGLGQALPVSYFSASFPGAVFYLRLIAASSSLLLLILIFKLGQKVFNSPAVGVLAVLLAVFSPGLIQSAHFGTAESLLAMLFLGIIHLSFSLADDDRPGARLAVYFKLSLLTGLALGIKISSLIFFLPVLTAFLMIALTVKGILGKAVELFKFVIFICLTMSFAVITSPFNILAFPDYLGALRYEVNVATGQTPVFYTRQFLGTLPVIFQLTKILPYALGLPVFAGGLLGFAGLICHLISCLMIQLRPAVKLRVLTTLYVNAFNLTVLMAAFSAYFLANGLLFVKWTRFMTAVLPLFCLFAAVLIGEIYNRLRRRLERRAERTETRRMPLWRANYALQEESLLEMENRKIEHRPALLLLNGALMVVAAAAILPGIMFMSVYAADDPRLTASRWIYDNIPADSVILSETANVVDIPVEIKSYEVISFNFYDLDENPAVFNSLINQLESAGYIFVPSRRIFMNHDRARYPLTARYYELLFNGSLGFVKTAEFNSFPQFQISRLAGGQANFKFQINDETGEETLTVFDHPVVRIYKKDKSLSRQEYEKLLKI